MVMSELRDLYQEVILDHNRKPRNFRVMEDANRVSEGYNPLCGDQMTVYLRLEGDRIADVSFQAKGCAISKASASMMTMSLKDKTVAEAEEMFKEMHSMLTGSGEGADGEALGRLAVLAGVRDFPSRVKCATLGWHALRAALQETGDKVSTE
jgi:nitrogen fixation NifU-like protein